MVCAIASGVPQSICWICEQGEIKVGHDESLYSHLAFSIVILKGRQFSVRTVKPSREISSSVL